MDIFRIFWTDTTITKSTKNYIVGVFFDLPEIYGKFSKYSRTDIRRIEILIYSERSVQSGYSGKSFRLFFYSVVLFIYFSYFHYAMLPL